LILDPDCRLLRKGTPAVAVAEGATPITSWLAAAGWIVRAALVAEPIPLCVTSEAVTVWLPEVLSVTLNVPAPPISAALAGNVACASEETSWTVSLVLITFQVASTARTVTSKAVPAVCAVGGPVLPVGVPGAAVSPGSKTCNWAKAPD